MSRRDFGYFVIMLIVMLVAESIYTSFVLKDNEILQEKNASLQQQLQSIQQEQAAERKAYKEGPYTMITDLSSFMYINGVSEDVEGAVHWTDVNGVSGFDITINGTHYRYVQGHIEMPQLALYAPYMTVMSDSVWPKEGK